MATQTVEVQETTKIDSDLVPLLTQGLDSTPRWLPSLFLWDEKGLQLFDEITNSEHYYPFRAETGVLSENATSIIDTR